MSGLTKASLHKLSNDRKDQRLETIPVQFNPASLKLTISNQTEGGQSSGRQARQYTGNASTELAFDLVFDTADEAKGPGGEPRSVREKTAKVEQFVLAQGSGGQRQSPPRVEFEWGGLSVKGLISSLAIDFDLFALDGTPLRAKMGVSIKEQDARYELLQAGPGASTQGGAPAPGEPSSATPGSQGGGASGDRAGATLEGESAAEFAARMGLDPGAWRGLAAGLEGTLSLEAGLEIGFDASLSLSAGVGVSVGFEADLGVSLEASLGLEASAGISAGLGARAGASASAGFALSAAGGVTAAVEAVKIARAGAAAEASARSFGAAGVAASAAVSTGSAASAASGAAAAVRGASARVAGSGVRTALSTPSGGAAGSSADAATAVPAAYAPPRADPRAASFGFGVPLRPRAGQAAQASAGTVALRPYSRAREAPATRDPTTPPWERLPAASAPNRSGGGAAGSAGGQGKGGRTDCGCGCGPRGGAR